MDLFSASDKVYLPQTVISLKSKNGLNFESTAGSNPIIEFFIPPNLGFINAEDTVLSLNFKYKTSGEVQNLRPQQSTGLMGCVRQIDVTSGDGTVLEQILDYGTLQGVLYSHDNGADEQIQDGEFKMRSQTELYCRDAENPTGFVNPSVIPTQVYDDTFAPIDNVAHKFQEQKVQLPIRLSAILGSGGARGGSIIPVGAIGGINVRFLLHPTEHFTILNAEDIDENVKMADYFYITADAPDAAGATKQIKITPGFNDIIDDGTGTLGTQTLLAEGLYSLTDFITEINSKLPASVTAAFNSNTAPTTLTITNNSGSNYEPATTVNKANFFVNFCKDASPSVFPIASGGGTGALTLCTQAAGDATNAIGGLAAGFTALPLKWKTPYLGNPFDLNTQPFLAGTTVQMETKGLSPNVFVNAGSKILNIQSSALTSVYNKKATLSGGATIYDRPLPGVINLNLTSAFTPSALPANSYIDDGNTIKTVVNNDVFYSMTNVSLDLTVIQPPNSYVAAMNTAVQSDQGLEFPINVFETLRSNVTSGEAITQLNLPYVNTSARSLISVPTQPGTASLSTYTDCNLLRDLHLTKHFYTYSGVRHPALGIDTTRLQKGLDNSPYKPTLSQELINAQVNAFEYSLSKVRSLDAYKDGYKRKVFFVGRNLGTLNSVMNLQNENLSLTLEATSGTPISKTLTVNNYLYTQNIIRIKSSGVEMLR